MHSLRATKRTVRTDMWWTARWFCNCLLLRSSTEIRSVDYKQRRIPSTVPKNRPSLFTTFSNRSVPSVISSIAVDHQNESALQRRMRENKNKKVIDITDTAKRQLRVLQSRVPEPHNSIRLSVKRRGCSGYSYVMEYATASIEKNLDEDTISTPDFKLTIDKSALFYVIGTTLDYVSSPTEERFVFRNPNIKGQCGCGESFLF